MKHKSPLPTFWTLLALVLPCMVENVGNVGCTTHGDTLKGQTRTFKSFSSCAEECGISRVYGGIHYRFSNEAGLRAGRKISDYVYNNFLQPSQS